MYHGLRQNAGPVPDTYQNESADWVNSGIVHTAEQFSDAMPQAIPPCFRTPDPFSGEPGGLTGLTGLSCGILTIWQASLPGLELTKLLQAGTSCDRCGMSIMQTSGPKAHTGYAQSTLSSAMQGDAWQRDLTEPPAQNRYLVTPFDGHDWSDMDGIHAFPHAAAHSHLAAAAGCTNAIICTDAIGGDPDLACQDPIVGIVLEVGGGVQ